MMTPEEIEKLTPAEIKSMIKDLEKEKKELEQDPLFKKYEKFI